MQVIVSEIQKTFFIRSNSFIKILLIEIPKNNYNLLIVFIIALPKSIDEGGFWAVIILPSTS